MDLIIVFFLILSNCVNDVKCMKWFNQIRDKHLAHIFLVQTPFGYTRKDVLLIGLGVTLLGVGLKSGLEVTSLMFFLHGGSF